LPSRLVKVKVAPRSTIGFRLKSPMVDLGATFTFTNLLGNNGSADGRALFLFANIRPIAI